MTRQIAVRLDEDIVEFLDAMVQDGRASSRADVVSRALVRERRRELAARDVEILETSGGYPDLDEMVRRSAGTPLDID